VFWLAHRSQTDLCASIDVFDCLSVLNRA
jgi:hypothetical protein